MLLKNEPLDFVPLSDSPRLPFLYNTWPAIVLTTQHWMVVQDWHGHDKSASVISSHIHTHSTVK